MKKQLLPLLFVVILLLLPLSATGMVSEKQIANNVDYEMFEVTIEIDGDDGVYTVYVYITNIGNETATVAFSCMPRGGFDVYTKNNILVYYAPQVTTQVVIGLTLEPGETQILYFDSVVLSCGTYSVVGFAETFGDNIYSEPETIRVSKAKSYRIFVFLEHFLFLERLLKKF